MLHLVSGINSLFVNLILVPVPPFPTHTFLYPSLLPLLVHYSAHLLLPLSFTPGLKHTCFTNPTPVLSLLPPGLPSRSQTIAQAVSSELLGFCCSFLFFVSVPSDRLSWPAWPSRQLLSARKSTVSYRIVSYRQCGWTGTDSSTDSVALHVYCCHRSYCFTDVCIIYIGCICIFSIYY